MSRSRRTVNPGKREREARKRHRRVVVVGNMYANHAYFLKYPPEAEAVPLKLGRKHMKRHILRHLVMIDKRLAVVDS